MRATEFAEDNFGTSPRRAARPGSRPHRGHDPIPQYRSMSETATSALQVGDPVIITGNVEYQGKTGDVREIGQNGAFVVVDLYNYGPYSFHASDVSYNDYADSEDELNEFALDDDGDDPTEDYPCYDCGSTIFLHHTKSCDFAEPNAKQDLPEKPGTQYWTGEIPKGLAPIPGLAEGVAEGDDRGDYHATARAANQASRTAKSKQQHAKAADLHSRAATYALSAGQDQSVINDHQMSAREHDRASRGLKESDMTEGAGTHQDLARMEARLKAARSGQVKMSFDAMRRLSSQIIKLKFDLGLLESTNKSEDQEAIRDRIAALQRDLKAVTGSYPGDDRNRGLIRSEIFRAKEELKAARGKKPGVTETNLAKYADMGANDNTTHFIKNMTTGKIVSPHRGLRDAQDALVANERGSNDKFKIVRARKSGESETDVSKYADMGATNSTTHFIKNMTTGKIVSPHRGLRDAQDALVANERGSNDKFKIVRARKSSVAEGSSFPGPLSNRDVATIGQLQRSNRGRGSEVTAPHQRSDWFDADSPVGAKKQKLAYLKAKKQGVAEGSDTKNIKPVTPAAKRYHEKNKWLLNGNIPGYFKQHYDTIKKLNQQGVAEGHGRYNINIPQDLLAKIQQAFPDDSVDDIGEWYASAEEYDQPLTVEEYAEYRELDLSEDSTDDDEAPYHTRILNPQTLEVIADDGPYDWENDAVDRAEAYLVQASRRGQNIVAQVYQPAYGKNYVTWQIPDQGDYNLEEQGVAEQDQVGNMPADRFDDAMARLKQLAGAGPLKTVWDPQKRVYKNVPTAVQPKK